MDNLTPSSAPALHTKIHPLIATAAIAVIVLALAGIGVLAGWISSPFGKTSPAANSLETFPPVATLPPLTAPAPAPVVNAAPVAAPPVVKVEVSPAPRPVARAPIHHQVVRTEAPIYEYPVREPVRQQPIRQIAAAPAPLIQRCHSCGVVESVQEVKVAGQGTGLGGVAGGVLGGVLGNQVGGGNGRKALTVLGAVGGAFAGNQVERHARSQTTYEIKVRMEDGSTRVLDRNTAPSWHEGDRVRVDGDQLFERDAP